MPIHHLRSSKFLNSPDVLQLLTTPLCCSIRRINPISYATQAIAINEFLVSKPPPRPLLPGVRSEHASSQSSATPLVKASIDSRKLCRGHVKRRLPLVRCNVGKRSSMKTAAPLLPVRHKKTPKNEFDAIWACGHFSQAPPLGQGGRRRLCQCGHCHSPTARHPHRRLVALAGGRTPLPSCA